MLSHDVNLPRKLDPVYPSRCVRCLAPDPAKQFTIRVGSIGWWTVVFWMFGSFEKLSAPCCSGCLWPLRLQRWLWLAVDIAVIGGAVWLALQILGGTDYFGGKWVTMGLSLVLLIPYFIAKALIPPWFDATVKSETTDYEFRHAEYAAEFAKLNDSTEE